MNWRNDERFWVMSLLALFVVVAVGLLFDPLINHAVAGTGGTEVNTLWTTITDGLEGGWGKLAGVLLIVVALVSFVNSYIVPGIVAFVLALTIGVWPAVVNARYTLTM